jgi:hypothetical protein
MVAGTKRGLFLFGLHTFSLHTLVAVFTAFFVEYYVHECLLIVTVKPGKARGEENETKAQLSTWGLSFFFFAQVMYATLATLYHFGLVSLVPVAFIRTHAFLVTNRLSSEQSFALLSGLSWSLLRFPLLPSAVLFTLLFAALSALSSSCAAFAAQAAREMALQRPKEGEWISVVARLASAAVAAVVFVAALLYDGTRPRRSALKGFHGLVCAVSVSMFCVFAGLQYLRRRAQAEESAAAAAASLMREESTGGDGSPSSSRFALLFPDTSYAEFHAFARQTCQRRSMKALLAVRALHCYAHSLVYFFFHLMLTLGCGLQLSAAARAALLAGVVAASAFAAPLNAAMCALLGKKRSVSLTFALIGLVGAMSLLLAYCTRDAGTSSAATPVSPVVTSSKRRVFLVEVSTAGTVWCVVAMVLQRLLLDASEGLLDLAQEDVVDEDAVLFGRASLMVAWTRRLVFVGDVPSRSLSFIVTLAFLAVSRAFRVVWTTQAAGQSLLFPGATRPFTTTSPTAGSASLSSATWLVAASGSTTLALLGLQTCGTAAAVCFIWHRYYNLDGKHLQFVQMATRKRKDEQTVALV